MVKGFKKDGKFRPTEKKQSGVSRKAISPKSSVGRVDNSSLIVKKKLPFITKQKAESMSNGDLSRSIDFVNGIFDNQTKRLEKSSGKFDDELTKEKHRETLNVLNMLIEEKMKRRSSRNKWGMDDYDDEDNEHIEPNPDFKKGDRVRVSGDNDNENYDSFRNKVLIVTDVTTINDNHPAFDSGMGSEGLYSFVTEDGEDVPFSLYDYELESI